MEHARILTTLSLALATVGCYSIRETPDGMFTAKLNARAVGVATTVEQAVALLYDSDMPATTVAFQPRKRTPYAVAVTASQGYLSGDLELAGVPQHIANAMEVHIYRFPGKKSQVLFYQDGNATTTTYHLNFVRVPELLIANSLGGPLDITVQRARGGGLADLVALEGR